jgi:serine/threonine protein kinase
VVDLQPGTRLERYEIVRELGQGGMAVVYEARHLELGSRHALKMLWPGPPQLAERLVQEGRLQAQLTHPNIVAVTDVVMVDGRPGLILEFVDGLTLDDWLAAHRDADEATRRRLACQVLTAVAHAHAHGTIHRDLKPANVLISGTDTEPWAKVADFGLAKWLHADGGGTRTGVPMGTPRYMAPEQIRDAKHVDERADVFALGCILAELWGTPAFDGTSIPGIFEKIALGKFDLPTGAPADVLAAIRGALVPDPAARTPSVLAMLGQLGCAGPLGSRFPLPAPPRRAPWLLAGLGGGMAMGATAVGVIAVVLCLGAIWWVQPGETATPDVPVTSPDAPAPAPDPARRGRPVRTRPAPSPSPAPAPAPGPAPPAAPRPSPSPSPAPPPSPGPSPNPGHGDDKKDKDEKEKKGKGHD